MANKIKTFVSKKKRRFQEDGFDLDLSYITNNIIAMGFPAEKLEGVYRNHIDDVIKFLEHRHKNRYKIYNLCSERTYDKTKFHGPVCDFPFDDHHPPRFEMIQRFCEDVEKWLSANTDNVAVVHCKAGKGRTGVMICACLLYMKRSEDAASALRFYSSQRTMDDKGVTIPSQRRYICYYDELRQNGLAYSNRQLLLHAIKFETLPMNSTGNCALLFHVLTHDLLLYQSDVYEKSKKCDQSLLMQLRRPLPVSGDVCVEFFIKPKMMKKEKILHFWFNTFFVNKDEVWSCDGSCGAICNDSETFCPVHQCPRAIEAHRQRETFQSQVMEQLCQLSQQQQTQGTVTDGVTVSAHIDGRLSYRHSEKYQDQRTSRPLSNSNYSASLFAGAKVPPVTTNFQCFKTLTLKKMELDKANKDKQHKIFTEDFAVKLYFTVAATKASVLTQKSLSNLELNKNRSATSSDSSDTLSDITDGKRAFSDDDYNESLSETDEDGDDDNDHDCHENSNR